MSPNTRRSFLSWLGGAVAGAGIAGGANAQRAKTPAEAGSAGAGVSIDVGHMAELRAAPRPASRRALIARIASYHDGLDGGGGLMVWRADDERDDDGGAVIRPAGLTGPGRWVAIFDNGPDVKRWGAKGDGSDATAAFDAARAYVDRQARDWIDSSKDYLKVGGPVLRVPAGDYEYRPRKGTQTFSYINIEGDSRDSTRIRIMADVYFVDTVNAMFAKIKNLHFYGGKGVYALRATGINVEGLFEFSENYVFNFTECAFGHTAADMPMWKVHANVIRGALDNKGERIAAGVIVGGKCDELSIRDNAFQDCRPGVKLDVGSNNAWIRDNAFFSWTSSASGKPACAVWLVPTPGAATLDATGLGVNILSNKFGNENFSVNDFRVLIAREGPGSSRLTRGFDAAAPNLDSIAGLTLKDNTIITGTGTRGFVYSTTPNLWDCEFDNLFNGAPCPTLEFHPAAITNAAPNGLRNRIRHRFLGADAYEVQPGSSHYAGLIDDPFGFNQSYDHVQSSVRTGFDPSLIELTRQPVSAFGRTGATLSEVTDSVGGNEAAEVSLSMDRGTITTLLTPPSANRAGWLALDLCTAPSQPLTRLQLRLQNESGTTALIHRIVLLPGVWRRLTLPWGAPSAREIPNLLVIAAMPGDYRQGKAARFRIGRVRCYHAAEPVHPLARMLDSGAVPFSPPRLPPGGAASAMIAVAGAEMGDLCLASFSAAVGGTVLSANVAAAGSVAVTFYNPTAAAISYVPASIRVRVLKAG